MNPITIYGQWAAGYALDTYSIKSTYLGDDIFGRPQFETTRSELGELIYKMKYNGHENTVEEIINLILPFVLNWLKGKHIDIIIAVPSSIQREFQPVFEISKNLAEKLKTFYATDILIKTSSEAVKNIQPSERSLSGQIVKTKDAVRKANVLLLDDIYDTGSTANECAKLLNSDPLIENVYFLALTHKKVLGGK